LGFYFVLCVGVYVGKHGSCSCLMGDPSYISVPQQVHQVGQNEVTPAYVAMFGGCPCQVATANASVRGNVIILLDSVGGGASLMFWQNLWIDGLCVVSITPVVPDLVKPANRRCRHVRDVLLNHAWALGHWHRWLPLG
jgi:hypothetical protein